MEFVYTKNFDRPALLDDRAMRSVEQLLLENPKAGSVIPGAAGARKLRAPLGCRGKRGGDRLIYLYVVISETIYFLAAYSKSVQANITPAERSAIKGLVERLKR